MMLQLSILRKLREYHMILMKIEKDNIKIYYWLNY